MKKFQPFFLALIFICTYTDLTAQKHEQIDSENFFRIGVKGGVNINKIKGQSYKSGFNYNYQLGGFMQFNFGRFGLQPEINFAQSSSTFSDQSSNVYNDLFRGGSQKSAKLNYLKVPLLLNINVGMSKHVKLQVGPQYSGLLKQSVDSLKNNQDIFKDSDFSMIGGLWIQLPAINFGARYELGLSNVNDVDNKERWESEAFSIFLGITF